MIKQTLALVAAAVTSIAISTQASTANAYLNTGIHTPSSAVAANDVQVELVGYKFHNGHSVKSRGSKARKFKHHRRYNRHNFRGHHGHVSSPKHHKKSSKHKKVLILKKYWK